MTLPQYEALEERRTIAIRQSRFNAALVASTIFNANRPNGSDPIEVWDFLAGFERSPEEEEQRQTRRELRRTVGRVLGRAATDSPERVRSITAELLSRIAAAGVADGEALIREVFPEAVV